MKTLVLGSTGFIGSATIAELDRRGIAERGLASRELDLAEPDSAGALGRLIDQRTTLFVACRAAQTGSRESIFSKDIAILSNLARCLEKNPPARCIYYSSLSVHGNAASNLAITEMTQTAPDSLYAISKFAGEIMLGQAAAKSAVPLLILRPPMVYGPGDTAISYGPARFIRSILEKGEVQVFGDGAELRGYIHVQDLVRITLELVLGEQKGIFCLDSGKSYSFNEMITHLRRISDKEFTVRFVARDRPRTDQRIDPSKLFKLLPDASFVDFAVGLAQTYDYSAKKGLFTTAGAEKL